MMEMGCVGLDERRQQCVLIPRYAESLFYFVVLLHNVIVRSCKRMVCYSEASDKFIAISLILLYCMYYVFL